MKTILGKKVNNVSLSKYENVLPGSRSIWINGMIWLEGDFNILIRRGKFFLQHKDGKSHGVILKGSAMHRRIRRVISIWFRSYRKELNIEQFQATCERALIPYRERIRAKLLQDLDSDKFYEFQSI